MNFETTNLNLSLQNGFEAKALQKKVKLGNIVC